MIYLSIVLLIISAFLAKFLLGKKSLVAYCALVFLYLFFLAFDYALVYFTGNTLTPFSFNMFFISIVGAPILTFINYILIAVLAILAIILFLVIFCRKIFPRLKKSKILASLCFVFALAALCVNPLTIALTNLYFQMYPPVWSLKKDIYPYIEIPRAHSIAKRPNIVYIFLESFNDAYTKDEIFPTLTPNFKALQNSMIFDDVGRTPGAQITIEGLFSSFCGVPYLFNFKFTDKNNFAKNIKCASGILQDLGYRSYFIKGADLEFQNTDKFLDAMEFDERNGRAELAKRGAKNYNEWGVDDDEMLEFAWEDFLRLSRENSPFLQAILTISTHTPNGFVAKSCENLEGNFKENFYDKSGSDEEITMLRAVACTDELVGTLIRKIRASEFSDNTIVVLQSDHPAPAIEQSAKIHNLVKSSEKLYFVINDPKIERNIHIARQTSTIDTFTTVLDYIGVLDAMQLGRSALSRNSLLTRMPSPYYVKAARLAPHIDYDEIEKAN
ncbi:sulfatase-like hydrolase/transferase [Campylobacter sp. JMF_04 NA10]|uniref:sulfatase-like hydrolase/transferase n=1 Tax=Campylobacter sp. JMF_04 NA10 TaxID=2983824 RepID=UPI0022E99866|nr:sulfatase-like hydrolase/transferase [Campylobacter sp. JMF_04 NA10]MDA3075826.1 sulfatase-like hydrolase/transferase [Campylobacter sp. JMF_04 NA10]